MKLDEYWVASSFVQFARNTAREARLALSSALITAIALLLAAAVSAQAEPVSDAATATAAAASDVVVVAEEQAQTIPTEPAPASAEPIEEVAASTVEAVPVKETAAAVESSGAAIESAAIESDHGASSPGAVADSPETATPRSVPSSSEVGAMVVEASKATVAATAGNVSELAGNVSRDSAETATSLVNRAAPPAVADSPVLPALARLVDGVLGTDQLRGLSQIVGTVVAPLDELLDTESPAQAVPASERIPRAATQPAPGVSSMGESPRPAVNWPLGGVLSRERAGYPPTFGDAGLAKLPVFSDLDLADAQAVLASEHGAAPGERSDGRAPLDPSVPLPGSSGVANGAPGSFFVPFAALFALLALTAPATRRRLEEAPAFRPSTPFVCGLERPG